MNAAVSQPDEERMVPVSHPSHPTSRARLSEIFLLEALSDERDLSVGIRTDQAKQLFLIILYCCFQEGIALVAFL